MRRKAALAGGKAAAGAATERSGDGCVNVEDTESDSDFESLNLVPKSSHGKRIVSSYSDTGRKRRIR